MVPGVESRLAAADRIIFIPPRVIIIGQFMQRRSRRGHALILEHFSVDARCGFRDQCLVRNVWVTSGRRLRFGAIVKQHDKRRSEQTWLGQTHEAKCNGWSSNAKAQTSVVT